MFDDIQQLQPLNTGRRSRPTRSAKIKQRLLWSLFYFDQTGGDPSPSFVKQNIAGFGVVQRNSEKVYFYQNEQAEERSRAERYPSTPQKNILNNIFLV